MKKITSFLVLSFFAGQQLIAQCAMCKASAETSLEASEQAKGINTGVFYALFFAAVVLSFIVYLFYKGNKSSQSE